MGLKKAIAINPAAGWMEGEKYMPEIQLFWRYEHNVDDLNDLRDELALCPAFTDWKVHVLEPPGGGFFPMSVIATDPQLVSPHRMELLKHGRNSNENNMAGSGDRWRWMRAPATSSARERRA
jgi:hypothetical protein